MGIDAQAISAAYRLGHQEVDDQHHAILLSLGAMWDSWEPQQFAAFRIQVQAHFSFEEQLGGDHGLSVLAHQQDHDNRRHVLDSFADPTMDHDQRRRGLLAWFLSHVNGADRALCRDLAKMQASRVRLFDGMGCL